MWIRNTRFPLLWLSACSLCVLLSTVYASDDDAMPHPDRLQYVEDELVRLGEVERSLRDQWMMQNRALAAARQRILRQDQEAQELQERIKALLDEVRRLQSELDILIWEHETGDSEEPRASHDSLQQEIMQVRQRRQELMQEHRRLLLLSEPAPTADHTIPAPDEVDHQSQEEDME